MRNTILIIFAVILTGFSNLSIEKATVNYSVNIKNGDTLYLNEIYNKIKYKKYFDDDLYPKIDDNWLHKFDNIDNNINDLFIYFNSICLNRGMGYWRIEPKHKYQSNTISLPLYAFKAKEIPKKFKKVVEKYPNRDWSKVTFYNHSKADKFQNFYYKLISNNVVRDKLIQLAIGILEEQVSDYPKDFKERILAELTKLKSFTNKVETLDSLIDTRDLRNYWEGFIYRRYKLNHISPLTIRSYLDLAINRINLIEPSENMIYLNININDKINYCENYKSKFLINNNNKIQLDSFMVLKKIIRSEYSNPDEYLIQGYKENGEFIEYKIDG